MGQEASGGGDASDATAGVPLAGEVVGGKFVVERVLGIGGMGVVVAAHHTHLDQTVAIKFLRRDAAKDELAVSRFLREARAVSALQSEHVVRVMDAGRLDDGLPYLVMEYLNGLDLDQVLVQRGQLAARRGRRVPAPGHGSGRRRPRRRDRAPRSQAVQPVPDGAGRRLAAGEGARLRDLQGVRRHGGQAGEPHGHLDDARLAALHVARAGAKLEDRRCADGRVGARDHRLRAPRRGAALRGRDGHRPLREDRRRRAGAAPLDTPRRARRRSRPSSCGASRRARRRGTSRWPSWPRRCVRSPRPRARRPSRESRGPPARLRAAREREATLASAPDRASSPDARASTPQPSDPTVGYAETVASWQGTADRRGKQVRTASVATAGLRRPSRSSRSSPRDGRSAGAAPEPPAGSVGCDRDGPACRRRDSVRSGSGGGRCCRANRCRGEARRRRPTASASAARSPDAPPRTLRPSRPGHRLAPSAKTADDLLQDRK